MTQPATDEQINYIDGLDYGSISWQFAKELVARIRADADAYQRGRFDAAKEIEAATEPAARLVSKFVTQTVKDAMISEFARGRKVGLEEAAKFILSHHAEIIADPIGEDRIRAEICESEEDKFWGQLEMSAAIRALIERPAIDRGKDESKTKSS